MNTNKRFLRDVDVEAEFGFPKAKTLRKWRLLNIGPKWRKIGGGALYDRSELEAYFSSCARGGQSQAEPAHAR